MSEEKPVPGWEWVTTLEGRCGGRPCIRGTRFDVRSVVHYLICDAKGRPEWFHAYGWDYIPLTAFEEIAQRWDADKIPSEWLEYD